MSIRLYLVFSFLFALYYQGHAFERLSLKIDSRTLEQFREWTKEAKETQIIQEKHKHELSGKVKIDNDYHAATLRLKGDWADHAKDRPSFRIKLKGGNSFLGMQEFSIQEPKTRGDAFEWAFHQMLLQQGILTTHYGFVEVYINRTYYGIYAIEEHFDDTVMRDRKKSVILKFDESGFWDFQYYLLKRGQDVHHEFPLFESATILPFNRKKIVKNDDRFKDFLRGSELLETLRADQGNLSETVDLDKFARYYALCDLTQAYHGLQWHNQRFYYNPVSDLLEPIGYDCFSDNKRLIGKDYLAYSEESKDTLYFHEEYFTYQLFNSANFRELYKGYMLKFSENNYLNNTLDRLNFYAKHINLKLTGKHAESAIFSPESIKARAKELRNAVQELDDTYSFTHYPYPTWKEDNPSLAFEFNTIPEDLFST